MDSRLPMILDALALAERDAPVRRLIDALGGEKFTATEGSFGEPAVLSRRVRFASGAELILHDDALVVVVLHTVPTSSETSAVNLSEWIPGATNAATLDDVKKVMNGRRRFAGFGTPYFELDGGYARAEFKDHRGWNDPGNLESLVFTVEQPGLTCRPEDDNCPACSQLLVRDETEKLDVEATVHAITDAAASGVLKEDVSWVSIRDLLPLHASGLMKRVESQLTCQTCRRILCIALEYGVGPTVSHLALNEARQHRLGPIPPVEEWGDDARVAEERDAMHYVDHEPGRWFLVEQAGQLFLDARYVVTNMVDDSALLQLDAAEAAQYRTVGRAFLADLAERIHDGSPHREESPFFSRDLKRGPEGAAYREAVSKAIVNHTWLARQRSVS
ncbi:hypothetical protein [Pseudoclavibacter sp. RFBB5]|uniref:hypothetical protein n=1 Tax=Pseudoclavibacter sp. RFBB5 TaxID=2080574 RepID=UPI000CE905DB|nr:hypothetical protein [Pseudoclavibacter sp. RFBB5]PPG30523.1 hypothetical protein C5B97_06950 [Pseudoclavibacter sp. RFBB5]